MWPDPQESENLVTFSEEILTKKHHFLCTAECHGVLVNAFLCKLLRNRSITLKQTE